MASSGKLMTNATMSSFTYWGIHTALTLLLPVSAILIFYIYSTPNILKDWRRRKLPPGPTGLPFIGNLFQLANSNSVKDHAIEWWQKYGDVFYTRIGGTDYIWLSSPKAVKDLMDKKSNIYSSRQPMPLAQDTASAGCRQVFMPYGPRHRVVRKLSHDLLNINATKQYQPVQDVESKQLMFELLRDPDGFYDYNRRYSASLICRMIYGERILDFENPLFQKIFSVLINLSDISSPGVHLIDTFPALKILPQWMCNNWKTYAQKVCAHDSNIYLDLWKDLRKKVASGNIKPCFGKDFAEKDLEKLDMNELEAGFHAGHLIEAGAETTSAALNSLILAFCLFPEASKQAQEELDRVVGPDRLPTFDDFDNLPYLRAVVKEGLRWRPPNQYGMHHAVVEDDWYEGMFIPKGSVVMLNWWAIHFDPEKWDDPFSFRPERYLDHPLTAATYLNVGDASERDHFAYGAGRRVCPGIHVAERSMFINIARILWSFNISKKTIDGKTIEPETLCVPGWLSVPQKFECSIKPRSEKHAEVIRREFEASDKDI